MEFISNFWAAYIPVAIVLVAAVVEWVADARKRRTPRPTPETHEQAPGSAVVFYMAWPRASSTSRRSVPAGAMPARVISLQEARRRRSHVRGESGARRNHA